MWVPAHLPDNCFPNDGQHSTNDFPGDFVQSMAVHAIFPAQSWPYLELHRHQENWLSSIDRPLVCKHKSLAVTLLLSCNALYLPFPGKYWHHYPVHPAGAKLHLLWEQIVLQGQSIWNLTKRTAGPLHHCFRCSPVDDHSWPITAPVFVGCSPGSILH